MMKDTPPPIKYFYLKRTVHKRRIYTQTRQCYRNKNKEVRGVERKAKGITEGGEV